MRRRAAGCGVTIAVGTPIRVDAYFGYKANERSRQFEFDEEVYEVSAVLNQWFEQY